MEYKKLNELCEINIGKTPSRNKSEYWGEGSSWLSISDLKDKFITKTKEEITSMAISACNMKIVPKDTVVMSFKLSIGKTAILKEDMYTNEAIANFPIKNNSLIPEYLYYAIKTLNFDNTDRAVMGATLNKAKLNELRIPYCKINKQKEIVEVLNKSQELIDKRKKQIEELDELVKSQFIEMFGDPGINPKGWEVNTLNGISLRKGEYGSGSPSIDYIEGNPRYIRITDINDSGYLNENKVTVENLDEYEKYKLNDGDILFARTGATVGKSFRYKEIYGECLFAGYLIRFIPNKKVVNPDFIYSFTKTNYYENWVQSKQRVVAQPNINAKQYGEELKIFVPPIELQNQFANFVKQVDKLKFEMEKSLKELEDNFNSLMQKAFKGELFN